MTSFAAIQAVEDALTDLRFQDKWGDLIPGDQMGGIARALIGEPWDRLDELFFIQQAITPREYVDRILPLVTELGRIDARRKAESKLCGVQFEFPNLPKTNS